MGKGLYSRADILKQVQIHYLIKYLYLIWTNLDYILTFLHFVALKLRFYVQNSLECVSGQRKYKLQKYNKVKTNQTNQTNKKINLIVSKTLNPYLG